MNTRGKISEISKLKNCVLMSNHSYNADFLSDLNSCQEFYEPNKIQRKKPSCLKALDSNSSSQGFGGQDSRKKGGASSCAFPLGMGPFSGFPGSGKQNRGSGLPRQSGHKEPRCSRKCGNTRRMRCIWFHFVASANS